MSRASSGRAAKRGTARVNGSLPVLAEDKAGGMPSCLLTALFFVCLSQSFLTVVFPKSGAETLLGGEVSRIG